MNRQVVLSNEIVVLRPLEIGDLEALFEVAKDPLIWEQHPSFDRYKREEFNTFFKESLDSGGALIVQDAKTSEVIGSSRYQPIPGVDHAIEIGWSFLARSCWGGTYNKAVKDLMISQAFEEVEMVIFYIHKQNIRSQKAVEKLGARRITGTNQRNLIRKHGSDLTYGLFRHNWRD